MTLIGSILYIVMFVVAGYGGYHGTGLLPVLVAAAIGTLGWFFVRAPQVAGMARDKGWKILTLPLYQFPLYMIPAAISYALGMGADKLTNWL